MNATDTIYALSTPPGTAGVAVIRLSGTHAISIANTLSGIEHFTPRTATRAALRDPLTAIILDDALIITFPCPASFTGEDVVELHTHGGVAVVQAVLRAIGQTQQARMAEPGEFTRRAFDNGKMDLTGTEALADLIHAETEFQRRQAMLHYQGGLRDLINQWRDELVGILAYCDATLDFADEELPETLEDAVQPRITALRQAITTFLNTASSGERLRDGIELAILGAPNAGKSSIINSLTGRDIAITSDVAGTTRDVVESHMDIGGYPFILADTAGLREETDDVIEAEGMTRALNRAQSAQIRLLIFDATSLPSIDDKTRALINKDALIVINKADVANTNTLPPVLSQAIIVSAHTKDGMDTLLQAITARAETLAGTGETPTLTRQRHFDILRACVTELKAANQASEGELIAESLRHATVQLGRMTGHVDVEDLLDVIFSDFCIGK